MLTFIHLSDIHFASIENGNAFDRNQQIRRALIEDLAGKPASGAEYDGILISGDIAFSGRPEEYGRAQEFITELCSAVGADIARVYMVPGNHDIDRAHFKRGLPLKATHDAIRKHDNLDELHKDLSNLLLEDPDLTLLAPLKAYNSFAQGYECSTGITFCKKSPTSDPVLSWEKIFPKPISEGVSLRLIGLNSAIISDDSDSPGNLLLSEFQTSQIKITKNIVNLVICHHPLNWLKDKSHTQNILRSFVPISLFGHEHEVDAQASLGTLNLFAGATQPPRGVPQVVPTYNIIQIDIGGSPINPTLEVTVYTREFTMSAPLRFRARRDHKESEKTLHSLPLENLDFSQIHQDKSLATPKESAKGDLPRVSMQPGAPQLPTTEENARHELLVHFFLLSTPQRFVAAAKAGLIRDGDDGLKPQVMWSEVFARADAEKSLGELWNAVSACGGAFASKANPFN